MLNQRERNYNGREEGKKGKTQWHMVLGFVMVMVKVRKGFDAVTSVNKQTTPPGAITSQVWSGKWEFH